MKFAQGVLDINQNPLVELNKYGRRFRLDNIDRPLITSGELKRLVENNSLRGVTSNPTIFGKATHETNKGKISE